MQAVAPTLNAIPTPPLLPKVVPRPPRPSPVATANERTFLRSGTIPRCTKMALWVACSSWVYVCGRQSRIGEAQHIRKWQMCIVGKFQVILQHSVKTTSDVVVMFPRLMTCRLAHGGFLVPFHVPQNIDDGTTAQTQRRSPAGVPMVEN